MALGRGRVDGLLLGREEEGRLRYAGHVERGLTGADVDELTSRLPRLAERKPPAGGHAGQTAKWVRPQVMVEVTYPASRASAMITQS